MNNEVLEKYLSKMIGRVFKILPLKEKGVDTLEKYIESLSREALGLSKVIDCKGLSVEISSKLRGIDCDCHETLREDVFSVITLINKLIDNVKEEKL